MPIVVRNTSQTSQTAPLDDQQLPVNKVIRYDDDLMVSTIAELNGSVYDIYLYASYDNGASWKNLGTIVTGLSRSRNALVQGNDKDLFVYYRTGAGTEKYVSMKKLTHLNGDWSVGSEKTVYNTSGVTKFSGCVESGGRLWAALRKYTFSTNTWGDLVTIYSDDDGDTWSSEQTIKSSSSGFIGYRHHLIIRDTYPSITYMDDFDNFRIREWNGSSWGSEISFGTAGYGQGITNGVVVIGTTLYLAYETTGTTDDTLYLRSFNGSTWSSATELFHDKGAVPMIGTDGTDLYITYNDNLDGHRRLFLTRYDVSEGKRIANYILDTVQANNEIWRGHLAKNCGKKPTIIYSKKNGSTYTVYSQTYNFSFGIKITADGYDVFDNPPTELSNIKNYILLSTQPTLKVKTAAKVSLSTGTSTTINHALGYPPICWVFMKNGSGNLVPVYDDVSGTFMYADEDDLVIENDDGATRDFYYYIFYDEA